MRGYNVGRLGILYVIGKEGTHTFILYKYNKINLQFLTNIDIVKKNKK